MSTQLILLTPVSKNGAAYTTGQIAVDVDDITRPIVADAFGNSILYVRKNIDSNTLADNVNADEWIVSETLTAIAAMSFDLQQILVTKPAFQTNVAYPAQTPVAQNMVFYLPNFIGPAEDDVAGCHFSYKEQGNPNPVGYQANVSVSTLVSAALPAGGIVSVNADIGPAVVLTVVSTGPGGALQWVGTQLQIPLSGDVIPITYAGMAALIAGNLVAIGQHYLITDRGDEGIFVFGTTVSTIDTDAIGLFLNADYGAIGDYSAVVPPFVTQLGVWTAALAPAIGDIAIWTTDHYVNISGANTPGDPSTDPVSWTLLTRTRTNGFIPVANRIIYNFGIDFIIYREDDQGNAFSGDPTYFQWGNSALAFNKGNLGSGTDFRNQRGTWRESTIISETGGTIVFTDFTGLATNIYLDGSSLINGQAVIDLTNCAGKPDSWKVSNGGSITAPLNALVKVGNIEVALPLSATFGAAATVQDKKCVEGYSNFEETEIITGTNVVNITGDEVCGRIILSSANPAETLDTITGLTQENFPVRFYPETGLIATFTNVAANYSLAGGIPAVLDGTNGDWVEFTRLNGVIYQTNGENY